MRPRVAFFSFGSCEGCQLQVLSVEEVLPELLAAVEIVNFREAMDDRRDDFEIAFVEGSVIKPDDVAELQRIRARARILVALGACACLGGVNALRHGVGSAELARAVYGGREDGVFAALPDPAPLATVVEVNYEIRGCPIDRREFLEAVRSLLAGTVPATPPHAVCVECTLRATSCLLERGVPCLGSVARAGCGAVCPAYGAPCEACRGFHDVPNFPALSEAFTRHGLRPALAGEKLELFNNHREVRKAWETAVPSSSGT
jgi:sulfhydrogenase subunit delta